MTDTNKNNFNPIEQEIYLKYILNPSLVTEILNSASLGDVEARKESELVFSVFQQLLPSIKESKYTIQSSKKALYLTTKKQEYAFRVCCRIILCLKWSLSYWMDLVDFRKQRLLVLGMFNFTHEYSDSNLYWKTCPVLYHRWFLRYTALGYDSFNSGNIQHSITWMQNAFDFALSENKDPIIFYFDLAFFFFRTNYSSKAQYCLDNYEKSKNSKTSFDALMELSNSGAKSSNTSPPFHCLLLDQILNWANDSLKDSAVFNNIESLLNMRKSENNSFLLDTNSPAWNTLKATAELICRLESTLFVDSLTEFSLSITEFVCKVNVKYLSKSKRIVLKHLINILHCCFRDLEPLEKSWLCNAEDVFSELVVDDISWVTGATRLSIQGYVPGQVVLFGDNLDRTSIFYLILARSFAELGEFQKSLELYLKCGKNMQNNRLLDSVDYHNMKAELAIVSALSDVSNNQFECNSDGNSLELYSIIKTQFTEKSLLNVGDFYITLMVQLMWKCYLHRLEHNCNVDKNMKGLDVLFEDVIINFDSMSSKFLETSGVDERNIKELIYCLHELADVRHRLRSKSFLGDPGKRLWLPSQSEYLNGFLFSKLDFTKRIIDFLFALKEWDLIRVLGELVLCVQDPPFNRSLSCYLIDLNKLSKEMIKTPRALEIGLFVSKAILECSVYDAGNSFYSSIFDYRQCVAEWNYRYAYLLKMSGDLIGSSMHYVHTLALTELSFKSVFEIDHRPNLFCSEIFNECVNLLLETKNFESALMIADLSGDFGLSTSTVDACVAHIISNSLKSTFETGKNGRKGLFIEGVISDPFYWRYEVSTDYLFETLFERGMIKQIPLQMIHVKDSESILKVLARIKEAIGLNVLKGFQLK